MKISLILTCCFSIFVMINLQSCNSSSVPPDYIYQPSAHVAPDTIYSNENHKLTLGLIIQTPQRNCWELDRPIYGHDSDFIKQLRFTYVTASIKKISTSTTCPIGLDTLRTRLTIPFDSAGTYYVDFPQVDKDGFLIQRRYQYTVQ